jgi:hypothetical protein
VAEPDRCPRDWSKEPQARTLVYANQRRIRAARGRRLMRQGGERIERSFAHLYDAGGMRRTHLRGHINILKRLLIHADGFNLGLIMRHLIGSGTPRGLQDRLATVIAMLSSLMGATDHWLHYFDSCTVRAQQLFEFKIPVHPLSSCKPIWFALFKPARALLLLQKTGRKVHHSKPEPTA